MAISSTGESADKLATLLGVYLTYGAFSLIITENTINSNIWTIADTINSSGFVIAITNFFNIVLHAYYDQYSDESEELSCEIYLFSSKL